MKDKFKAWAKWIFGFRAHGKRIWRVFFIADGGKEVARKVRIFCAVVCIVALGAVSTIFMNLRTDTSVLGKTDHALAGNGDNHAPASNGPTQTDSAKVGQMLDNSETKGQQRHPRGSGGRGMKVNYKAQQVLVSEGAFDPARTMPMGTNLIGKTLTTIDTRDAGQLVKVLLPYGGRANAGGELPKSTILFGQVTYSGKGEKVFVKFSKGVLPSGEEVQVEAQGLNPGDYSTGLAGEFHGNADMRVASSLGLTMVAGMSDVLTEKESLGGSGLLPGSVTPKATMKNAIYHGVSEVAKDEATRQAEAIGQGQEYVTVDAGTDIIVSLTKAYIAK